MNEKHKATLIVTLLMILLALTLVWQGTNQHNTAFNLVMKAGEEELQSTLSVLEQYSFTPYKNRIQTLISSSPEIIQAFADRDRQHLYQAALPRFEALKRENTFFEIMHFHLPDGKTFLRVHIPDFYDDDLTDIRPMITAVHQQHKPLSGIEIGRSGPFFRVVEPIFNKGVYIGALEFGIFTHQTLDMLGQKHNLIFASFFNKEAMQKSFLFDKGQLREMDNFVLISHKKEIFDLLPPDLKAADSTRQIRLNGKSYIMHIKPIFKDYTGHEIGGIIVLQDISPFVDSKKTFFTKTVTLSFFLVLICFFVVYFYFNKILGTLLTEIAERRKTEKALRTSESRFRLLVHDLPNIAVQGYDKERRVVLWNKGSELLYGYSHEEALGRKLEDLIIPPAMRDGVIEGINAWLDIGIVIPASELTLTHKDGHPVPVYSSHALIYKHQGEPEIYCVDIDLRELKEAREKQTIMEQQLVRAQKMEAIGLMAGGVAHDLNNILSGIVSYPELLLMQLPADSPMRDPLETIKESGARAAAVVADLLTVARGVAKSTEIANPNKFITSYLQSGEYAELSRRHPHINITTSLAPDLKNIRCSGVHIMKVITNLVNNAAEAIQEQGRITITTSLVTVEEYFAMDHDIEPGEYCLLAVKDNGPGISPEDLARIFEPFFTKKVMGRSGTGLGLAVVWNTMKDHGGVVTAESSAKGSCFNLYFPACDEESSLPAEETELAHLHGNGETILVVDDEKHQRLIAERILTMLGYQVHTSPSGEQAVNYLKDHKVDLVVLDMIMDPGMSGKETYSRIIKIHPGQKAIIASGFSESDAVKETLKLGAGQYIRKPYSLNQLGSAVHKALSST